MRKPRKDKQKTRARDGQGRAVFYMIMPPEDRSVLEQVAQWHGIRNMAAAARRALRNAYTALETLDSEPAGKWSREYIPAQALPIALSREEEQMLAAIGQQTGIKTVTETLRYCIHREMATLR